MTDDLIIKRNEQKEITLLQKRREILTMEPEKALDTLLNAPLPAELIQSFPEQDLFYLIHDIGVTDAVPILAMATSEQWGYILDVEIWNRDRMNIDTVTRWFQLLLLADGRRLVNWLLKERLEFLELYLFKNIHVIIREENQTPSEIPDAYFTVDDYFYVKVKDKPVIPEPMADMITQNELEMVVHDLIDKIIDINHFLYQSVMLEAMSVIPAEVEEEDYRIRNIRLAEKGFLPFDESIEVLSPVTVEQIEKEKISRKAISQEHNLVPAPGFHMGQIRDKNLFTVALEKIGFQTDMSDLEMEFASLCNQVIAAEQKTIKEKDVLGKIVRRVSFFVSIGMEILGGREILESPQLCVNLVMNHSFKNLFRLGHGRVVELKWKARRICKEGWFAQNKLPLSFWGEHLTGVTGGLLIKSPMFYDNYTSGPDLYRDFKTCEDVTVTDSSLDLMKHFDDLFSMMNPELSGFGNHILTYENLIMTLWFSRKSGRPETDEGPVDATVWKTCFLDMWEPACPGISATGKKIKMEEKSALLSWLAGRSGFTEEEISSRLGHALETLFSDMEKDYGTVPETRLDPRYIPHICVDLKTI